MPARSPLPSTVDVLVVGSGVAGTSIAHHVRRDHPELSLAVVEARATTGGTWDVFRYPGVRSDSDLQTFGFSFKPWTGEKSLADGASILAYVREAAVEHGIDERTHVGHRVVGADWHSGDARWHVTVRDETGGTERTVACRWLATAAGYFDQEQGHVPDFPGRDRFPGPVVHPQHWPDDVDVAGRRVVVIGSGATAVTLVPALVDQGARVTMLQRSPGYVLPVPDRDVIANGLRRVLGDRLGHAVARWKNVKLYTGMYRGSKRWPGHAKRIVRRLQERLLPPGFDIDTHFTPRYDPWDERMCLVPNGDLFAAIRGGGADVVTDRIATFTGTGVELESGAHLDADVIVSATGFRMRVMGGFPIGVDGVDMPVAERVAFRGAMLSDLPNLSFVIGYVTNSWTLKADLVAEHVSRVLTHLAETGADAVVPRAPEGMTTGPLLGAEFNPGYVRRSMHLFPRQGDRDPWTMPMVYGEDVARLRHTPIASRYLEPVRLPAVAR